jgi:hypothetical protein
MLFGDVDVALVDDGGRAKYGRSAANLIEAGRPSWTQ